MIRTSCDGIGRDSIRTNPPSASCLRGRALKAVGLRSLHCGGAQRLADLASVTRPPSPRVPYIAAGRSAWRTWASVTTPCSTPSPSTATIAPRRPRPSEPSSDSSGACTPMRTGRSGSSTSTTGQRGPSRGDLLVDPRFAHDPEEVLGRIDHGEPGPAVAQEELLLCVEQRQPGGDGDGLAIHDVGHGDALDALPERTLHHGLAGGLVEEEGQHHPDQPERGAAAPARGARTRPAPARSPGRRGRCSAWHGCDRRCATRSRRGRAVPRRAERPGPG